MKKRLRGVLVAAFWLLVWQLLSAAVDKALLLPSPLDTLRALLALMGGPAFWKSTLYSLLRIMAGYACALIGGCVLGVVCAAAPPVDALLRPMRSIMKAMPVASFILLVLLFLNPNIVPAFTAFVMVLPLVWANVQEGILATDAALLEMGALFRLPKSKVLREIYLPSVMPSLLSACATGLGFAWKAGVAAEVLARTVNSIGKNLVESKTYLETADMFAWTAVVILLSVLLERLLVFFMRRIRTSSRWRAKT